MKIKDVMTPDPACCTMATSLQEVAQMMFEYDCGAIPVVDNHETRRLIGIITDRDITVRTAARGKNPVNMRVEECMSRPVVTVTPEDKVEIACQKMEENQVRRIPVVDELNRCCGIVAQADIALNTSKGTTAGLVQKVSEPNEVVSNIGAY